MKYLNLASRELRSAIDMLKKEEHNNTIEEILYNLEQQEEELDRLIMNVEDKYGTKRR